MTILSNHRLHSCKSLRYRSISPKKVPTQKVLSRTGKSTKVTSPAHPLLALLISAIATNERKKYSTVSARPTLVSHEPSAPNAEMQMHLILVQGKEYHVEIPEGCDVEYALKQWYPGLYTMIQENNIDGSYPVLPEYEESVTEEDIEAAWAYYDYLEWLYD